MQILQPAAKNRMMLCTDIGCCFQNRFSAYSLSIQDVTSNTFRQPKSEIYTLTPLEGSGSTALTLSINEPSYFDYEVPEYREHVFEVQNSQNSRGTVLVVCSKSGPTISSNHGDLTFLQYWYFISPVVLRLACKKYAWQITII